MYPSYLEPKILLASVSQVWGLLSGLFLSNSLATSSPCNLPHSGILGPASLVAHLALGDPNLVPPQPYHKSYLPR